MKLKINKLWAICAQTIFAMFVIIALYAVGFKTQKISDSVLGTWASPSENAWMINNTIYGLSIAGIVIAFAAILPPLASMFFGKKTSDSVLGWLTILLDLAALTLLIAAIAEFAQSMIGDGTGYDKGYLAGQFIFIFVGAAIAFAGIGVSYKEDLLKLF